MGRSCGFAGVGWTWRDEAVGAISKIFWCKRKCSLTISRVCTWQFTKGGILVCTRLAIHFSFHRPMCQLKRPSFPLNEVKTRRHFLCFPCRSCRSDLSHTNVRTPDSLVWRQETLLGTGDFVPPLTTKEPGGKWRSTSRSRAPLRGKDSVFKTHRCASPPELLKTKD